MRAQRAYLQKQVELALSQERPMHTLYAALGRGIGKNLPGTLREVKTIQQIVKGSEVISGQDVNETRVKLFPNEEN